jgi:hypothetical protein
MEERLLELVHHLLENGCLADHQVIGQQHGKGLAAHQALAAQHGVAQAQAFGLAHEHAFHVVGFDGLHQLEQLQLAGVLQFVFELKGGVEMVFDGALVAAGHEDHLADAGVIGLFNGVLDQGLVDHRQHFFGLGLGGRQKTGSQAGNRKDGFGDDHGRLLMNEAGMMPPAIQVRVRHAPRGSPGGRPQTWGRINPNVPVAS